MRDDADKSRLLLELNNALISQLDLEELLRSIFDLVKRVFHQTIAATLSLHDPHTNELRIHLLHSEDPDLFREGMALSLDGTPSGVAFSKRQTVLIKKLVYEDFPSPLIEGAGTEDAFSDEDAVLLTQVGRQIAMPIENALNMRLAQRESDRNQVLHEVGQAIVSTLSLNDLFKTISQSLRRFLNHDMADCCDELRSGEDGCK